MNEKHPTDILQRPPAEWREAVEAMNNEQRRELVQALETLAWRATFLSVYTDARIGYGCGDQGHETAVREANEAARIVKTEALDYTAYRELRI